MGKISIIVPVYNAEKSLEKCLDSLINQTYRDLEIILVNDGSKDRSGEICDIFSQKDSRIKVINQRNQGVSITRNSGIMAATGEVIQFVDSDDWLELDCCDLAYKEYSKNKSNLIIWGYSNYIDSSTIIKHIYSDEEYVYLNKGDFIYVKYNDLFNVPWNKLFSLSIIRDNNILFKEGLSLGEDLLFNLDYIYNMNKEGQLVVVNRCLYNYYEVNSNTLSKIVKDDYIENRQFIYDRLYEVLEKYSDMSDDILLKYYTLRKRGMQKIIIGVNNNTSLSFKEKYKKIDRVLKSDDYDTCINKCEYGSNANLKRFISKIKLPIINMILKR